MFRPESKSAHVKLKDFRVPSISKWMLCYVLVVRNALLVYDTSKGLSSAIRMRCAL